MGFGVPLNPDGLGSGSTATSNWTSGSYTVPAGSNKRLVVVVGAHAVNTTATTASSATFGAEALTGRLGAGGVGVMQGQWWFNVYDLAVGSDTPTDTFNIQISNSRRFVMVAFTLEDADQTEAPMISSVEAALSHVLNDVPSGWLSISGLVDLGSSAADPQPGTGQTLLYAQFGSSSDRWAVASYRGTSGGTQSFDYTNANATSNTGIVVLAYKPAGGGGDTITAGKAGATASAHAAQISAGTTIVAGKASAAAVARAAIVQSGISIVLGKALAVAQARAASIVPTTVLTLGKATAAAAAHSATVTAGLRIVGGKAVAAASALAASIVETTTLTLGKATAAASARHASISDGSAPAGGGLLGGLIVNVGRLLSRF
jgi:hypothetical protein